MSASSRSRLLSLPLAAMAMLAAGAGAAESDPLAAAGWRATGGAAPGYVDDQACRSCHEAIWTSYQEVAMAQAFYRPRADKIIETLGQTFHHAPSDRYYEMSWVDGRYRFQRYQRDDSGRPINVVEQDVDWVLGSGNHSRTYLVRSPEGELFQLPLAWYSQTDSWGMAPGYDKPFHLGLQRQVLRECMFCHSAYPEVPVGSDLYGAPPRFPEELPAGLGCQRCHGPGAVHASLALAGDIERAIAAIVNPGKLDPERRDDICYGCHLQPSVSLIGVRRFGRSDYSFRPGQSLSDYSVALDVVAEGEEAGDRFEINHHPYRLEQSRCFTESAGELSCLTCHDPHRKVAVADRAAWYGERCLGCHRLAETTAHAAEDPGDCVPCHMPERRTQDVVQVTMTDHLIQRGPVGPEATVPRAEREPVIVDATFLYPHRAPTGPLAGAYRAAAVVRADGGMNVDAVRHLERVLAENPTPEIEPWLLLAKGQLGSGRLDALETTMRAIFDRVPGHPLALEWLGLARDRMGERDEAIRWIRRAAAVPIPRAEAHFNLGLLLAATGEYEEALASLERALEVRPTLSSAWYYIGKIREEIGEPGDGVTAYRRALEIDPSVNRAYVALGEALLARGDRAGALRYLRHGARAAREPGMVAEALERVAAEETEPAAGR